MKTKLFAVAFGLGLLLVSGAQAQAPASVTAVCKDGSSFSGTSRSGACRGHGGVGTWGTADTAGAAATAPKTTDATPATAPSTTKSTAPAAGGGAGQVWVNNNSKVYHCPGDRYYGKTKSGTYMTEPAAKAAGDRPAGGKTCS